jgi:signal peptidase I
MAKTTSRQKRRPPERNKALNSTFSTIKSLGLALILALLIKYSVIEAYNVPTGSMEDTILVGDFLLANKFIYGIHVPLIDVTLPGLRDPRPGDIVVFKWPGDSTTNYVKRCIAVGGQTVLVKDKKVYVDGKLFHNYPHTKFTDPHIDPRRDDFGPFKVPEGHFFMMGDNRDDSYDSRYWHRVNPRVSATVPRRFILGEALIVHWSWGPPPDPDAPKWEWSNPVTWPASLWYNFIHFHQRVRWNRLGKVLS